MGPADGGGMSDGSGQSTFTDGYVVPIAGLLALLFALMAGLTAGRALSGDPTDTVLPVGFVVGALVAIRIRQRAVAARESDDATARDDG